MKISDRKVGINIERNLPSCISSPEEMLLFDIETTGLKREYCRVYLIGCAYMDMDGWHIRQYLTECREDEKAVLCAFADLAENFKCLMTFNGEGFDIPFIACRNRYYGLSFDIDSLDSFDIYKAIKPVKKLIGAKSFSQKAVEELIGIRRDDKLNGGLLIPYYYEYEALHSFEDEKLLLLHNFEDVLGMAKILPALDYLKILDGAFGYSGYAFEKNTLAVTFILDKSVPAGFDNGKVKAAERTLCVYFDVKDEKVLLPLKGPENYYYLPAEDTVIHKDLASFVDKKYRIKATRENCFLKVGKEKISGIDRDDLKSYAMNIIDMYK